MGTPLKIAIDVMGGEHGPEATVPAAIQAIKTHPAISLFLVGDQALINAQLTKHDARELAGRFSTVHSDCVIQDDELPTRVLREKNASSMFKCVELVQQGEASACVSAGNTGALLLSGRHLLKTIEGIDKPAMVATLPGSTGHQYLLDVGANLDCKGEQLFQFAVMGAVLAESLDGLSAPRVALLNIGSEDYKGGAQVRLAAGLLESCDAVNYVGYVEGGTLFEDQAEVVVCDGFVGNVMIKTSAGVVRVVNTILEEHTQKSWRSRVETLVSSSLIKRLHDRVNPSQFNGASLIGLQGSIIKSHGNATLEGFRFAIERAINEASHNVPQQITAKVAEIMRSTDT